MPETGSTQTISSTPFTNPCYIFSKNGQDDPFAADGNGAAQLNNVRDLRPCSAMRLHGPDPRGVLAKCERRRSLPISLHRKGSTSVTRPTSLPSQSITGRPPMLFRNIVRETSAMLACESTVNRLFCIAAAVSPFAPSPLHEDSIPSGITSFFPFSEQRPLSFIHSTF
jgi:hypothetical protein